jgi:hypothetical protein
MIAAGAKKYHEFYRVVVAQFEGDELWAVRKLLQIIVALAAEG